VPRLPSSFCSANAKGPKLDNRRARHTADQSELNSALLTLLTRTSRPTAPRLRLARPSICNDARVRDIHNLVKMPRPSVVRKLIHSEYCYASAAESLISNPIWLRIYTVREVGPCSVPIAIARCTTETLRTADGVSDVNASSKSRPVACRTGVSRPCC
jgi:hypothetical protein